MDNLTIERRLCHIDKQTHELDLKLDKIIYMLTPKLSELQDREVSKLFREIDPLRDIIGTPDNFNENTDKIINDNKLI